MIPKATENTITTLLKDELKSRGVKARPFLSVETPEGRREVDIWCTNGGAYPIEAKFTERDFFAAVSKVSNDYIKHYKTLRINGGFALLYPDELSQSMPQELVERLAHELKFKLAAMFLPEDARKSFTIFEGKLSEIADILAKYILTPPEYVEPSVEYIIKVLSDSAKYLTASLKHLSGADLEDLFGGEEVFKHILQYEKEEYPVEELRLAAAYILVNQLLFYHVLSRRRPYQFPEIDVDKIKKPVDLLKYYLKVLGINYRAVLQYDVVSRIPEEHYDVVRKIIGVIKALSPEKVGGDLLGTIFHNLIPFETRKKIAAFYTNVLAAELLANLVIDRPDAKVADLAVGSGGLLVAAYRMKKMLFDQLGVFMPIDHARFVEEDLLGIDVMPFAANVAACHLALQSPEFTTDKVQIAVWDSTKLSPGKVIQSVSELGYGEKIALKPHDIIIMNPPFTRQQRIPSEYKGYLGQRLREYEKYISHLMGYHGYFILLADRFLKKEGRLALVLPATVLNADGFLGIRKILKERYQIEHIVTTWQRSAFSEATQFREILLIAKKLEREAPDDALVGITELKKLPRDLEEARQFAEKIKTATKFEKRGTAYEDDAMQVTLFEMKEFKESTDNFFKFIAFKDKEIIGLWRQIVAHGKDRLVEFGRYLAEHGSGPREGAALGQILKGGGIGALYVHKDASRMLKKTDVWVLKSATKKSIVAEHKVMEGRTITIPCRAIRPAVRRFSGLNVIDISDELDYLVAEDFSGVSDFISLGLGKKISASFFRRWKKYVDSLLGNLFLACHVDVSASGTSALAYYTSSPTLVQRNMWSIEVPNQTARILSLWLNSTIGLLQILLSRKETRGAYIRLDAGDIKKYIIPAMENLSKKEFDSLLQLFNEVRDVRLPSILEQLKGKHPTRIKIDKAILQILGFNEKETDQILNHLYLALADEIERLKTLMEG